ncbi:YchF/TatD family DNA exonuclease [Novosphingobium sp. FSY-8]|uniref:YchF/TatD family DNA exonuclease n=1 Tax=Novosphingobium ovatum TaxID=1908523 RepID=A0ABW9XCI5_9SPHN|nr:TatD family hydrolase [Novosphingobium ovatum]NBC36238.1 YchF/TatD family DNA exonuclease [Novosphingobium ovatum]
MLIDSHCHLNYKGLVEQQGDILTRARAAGIGGFLNISTRQREWADIIATADAHDDVWASVGIHPHEADEHIDLGAAALLAAAHHPKVIAIGETGLDYYYDHSDRAAQQALFRTHIAVARETGLPLIIHTRDAEEDTTRIIAEEMAAGAFPALIHCFTASAAFGQAMLDLGLTISISGIVTFKNAHDLQAVAADIPADRLLVETDAPFLAPVPHRGKVCEPAFTADTARFVAGLRGVSVEELAAVTTANFFRLFTKAQGSAPHAQAQSLAERAA